MKPKVLNFPNPGYKSLQKLEIELKQA